MKNQQGQILLITVMLLATAITVVLSVSFTSTTETQITKLEEESQKALAAAEAGIEASLKSGSGTGVFSSLNLPGIDAASSNVSFSTVQSSTFVTPLLQKDEQYTFYLANYPGLTAGYWSGNLDVYFQSEASCPAIELTFIKSDSSLVRNLMDPCNLLQGAGETTTGAGGVVRDVTFTYKNSSPFAVSNTKLLIVRTLSAATKIGFSGSANFPLQGKTVTSEAKSTTGVTKSVVLFQSYPQIPADFFVTSF